MAIQMGRALPRRSVNVEGAILVPHSLAHVNRELTLALLRRGVDVGLRTSEPDRPELFGDARFAPLQRCPSYPEPEVVVRHAWPPDFGTAGDAFIVHLMHWEYGAIPRVWIEALGNGGQEIWVLSNAVRDAFVRAGVDVERVSLIGGGVDPELFHPGAPPLALPTRKGFRFLYVGAPLHRKGIDVLLEAYRQEFRRDEDVALVIKDLRAYTNGCRDLVRAAARDAGGPEVVVLDDDLAAERMPSLYTACQALVQPYRAEGFCLPLIEAMACGLAVAGTAHGASLDFLDGTNGFPIAADEVAFGEDRVEDMDTVGTPFWAEPRLEALRATMRQMFEDAGARRVRGAKARTDVCAHWTWDLVGDRARARLDRLFAEREQRLRALELFMTGSAALEEGRPWDACRALAAALEIEPCFPQALSEYGVALAGVGELEAARSVLERAESLDPGLEEARISLDTVRTLIAGQDGQEPTELAA